MRPPDSPVHLLLHLSTTRKPVFGESASLWPSYQPQRSLTLDACSARVQVHWPVSSTKLTSVLQLREVIQRRQHYGACCGGCVSSLVSLDHLKGLKELVQHHKFVGCASASISLVQFQVSHPVPCPCVLIVMAFYVINALVRFRRSCTF